MRTIRRTLPGLLLTRHMVGETAQGNYTDWDCSEVFTECSLIKTSFILS